MSAFPTLPAGFQLFAYERVGSTSDEAKRLAAEGAPHGSVVWARVQTEGRGRRGRSWTSPEGNLYVSYLLRPTVGADRSTQAGFVAALALAETVRAFLPGDPDIRCKWPNDILANRRKIAGILLESALTADGALDWLIVGCGLNRVSHPADTRWSATDLDSEGARDAPLERVLETLTSHLAHWMAVWQHEGFERIRAEWQARAWGLDQDISLTTANEIVRGRFVGLADDGALLLDTGSGRRAFRHGDVSVAGA